MRTGILLLLGLVAPAVMAQAPPAKSAPAAPAKPMFDQVDASGDGFTAVDEERASRRAEFKGMDQSGDGRPTGEEVVACAQYRRGEKDTNRDKKAAADEQEASADQYSKAIDKNGDGAVTVEGFLLFRVGPADSPSHTPGRPAPRPKAGA